MKHLSFERERIRYLCKMKNLVFMKILILFLTATKLLAIPLENRDNVTEPFLALNQSIQSIVEARNTNDKDILSEKIDLDTAASEGKATAADYDDRLDAIAEGGDNQQGEGSMLDAFQQYVNRFGAGAYSPYPGVGAYPAPISYNSVPVPVPIPAVYPAPYAVQTAYEGYLVPTSTASTTTSSTTAATTTTSNPLTGVLSLLNPLNFFTNLIPTIMMSTLFRVIAGIFSVIGMVFFSGALTDVVCNFTPLCDLGFSTATYFMRLGRSNKVGRLLSEEITPERLSQAEDFVRKAIRTYRDLQNSSKTE